MKLLDAVLRVVVVEGVEDPFGGNVTAWCASNGINLRTFYRHKARVEEEGVWTARSRRPLRSPGRTPGEVEAVIVALRASLGRDNGADSIGYELERVALEQDWKSRGWVVPSRTTINNILTRRGLVVAEPAKRPKSSYRRFAYARPRDCYQIDATVVTVAGGAKLTVFEVLDDCTRTLVATHVAHAETGNDAITAITKAFGDFGVPAIVLSDNGAAFTSRFVGRGAVSKFTRKVTDAGARLIHSSPYHPQTCGKVERHHRTFKQWLADHPTPPATDTELQTLCDTYQHWYNTQRRHSAWNKPPIQAWTDAAALGGPEHLPVQQDATIHTLTVSSHGVATLGNTSINLGRPRAGHTVTILRDGDHIIAYTADGATLGHLDLDPTKRYQGQLRPAA